MSNYTHYFGAGPAALPLEVKQQIESDINEYQNTGVSILELSHRSDEFFQLLHEARELLRDIYSIPQHYHIVFMAGGATLQFDAVALNLAGNFKYASYLDTGFWSRKAGSLASKYVDIKYVQGLVTDTKQICCIDCSDWHVDSESAYLHITPNETIYGVEFVGVCNTNVPIVADLTSSMLMQNIDVANYGLLYAAAQKSLGIAGLSVVILRDDLLTRVSEKTPDLLRYDLHVEHHSIVNTAPVFACYVTNLMLNWIKQQGGLDVMVQQAQQRSSLLYEAIDANDKFTNNICTNNRSTINVAFDAQDQQVIKQLLNDAESQGLLGLQGHRHAGGIRASMYNGTPIKAVENLAELIRSA